MSGLSDPNSHDLGKDLVKEWGHDTQDLETMTPEEQEQYLHDKAKPTQEEMDKAAHNNPANDIETPYQEEYNGSGEPPQTTVIDHEFTIPSNIGGNKMTWKKLGTLFKNLFTKAENFLDPFIKQVQTDLTPEILGLAAMALSGFIKDPKELDDTATRNAAIQAIIKQAEADGITVAEKLAGQAADAIQAHMIAIEATAPTPAPVPETPPSAPETTPENAQPPQ